MRVEGDKFKKGMRLEHQQLETDYIEKLGVYRWIFWTTT
jgi:hypothetical protein